jgi:serine/threonine-protein kinase RsbW
VLIAIAEDNKLLNKQKFSLRVSTDLDQSNRVQEWFEQNCAASLTRKTDAIKCKLALIEAFTNVVRYAHHSLPQDTAIDLEGTISSHQLELRIWDFGPPFDFDARLQKALEANDCFSGGGRGLIIIYQGMDFVTSTRTDDGRNCLLMVKHYPQAEDEGEGERG